MNNAVAGLSWAEAVAAAPPRDPLTPIERTNIITMFTSLLDGLYVNRPPKRAMDSIDPLQQLCRMYERAETMSDETFHREIGAIVTSVSDIQTAYIAPSWLAGTTARLPFLVEQLGADDEPRFIVTKIIRELVDDPDFVPGVELVEWNGVPIADAVRCRGESERGMRPDSAMARALDSLTFRPLGIGPPPDEQWIVVGYRDRDDAPVREHRFDWRFIYPGPPPDAAHPTSLAAAANAIHPDRALVRRAKKLSFDSRLCQSERQNPVAGHFYDTACARVVAVDGRDYGYLRLWSFEVGDDDAFVAEVVRLLAELPQRGLIVDLRGNPGGLIWAAERLLQLFTPSPIAPIPFSIVASNLTRAMTDAPQNRGSLGPWRPTSLDTVDTGEDCPPSAPITPAARCNDIGQVYGGPVIAVIDSTTYSAADLFVAGLVDNGIGNVVSVGMAADAGFANAWSADMVSSVLAGTLEQLPHLPKGVGFTMSVRRAAHVSATHVGHVPYVMTRNDLLNGNEDLLTFCARLIESTPASSLTAHWKAPNLEVAVAELDRIDVCVDGRPPQSHDITDALQLTIRHPRHHIRIEGYEGAILQQVRTIRLT
ncbi:MAG TPA: S41 family peptidase [Ilumatobacteraceae bacterium]|nr:S41 family peptidase [Ilumatobacteraceae bacterium]